MNIRPLLLIFALAVACGTEDSPDNTADMPADTRPDADLAKDIGSDLDDMGDEVDMNVDANADAGGPICTPPMVQVAGTPTTNALADSPARCGAPAYSWLRDESLGDIVGYGEKTNYKAALIKSVAETLGVTLPREAEYDATVEQVIYRTQDRGQLVDATTLIAYPKDLSSETTAGVILLLHGSAGFNDSCSPSLERGAKAMAAILATFGYLVVAPDYLGLKGAGEPTGFKHPYLVGEPTAIASLDAVRALHKLPPEKRGDLCPSAEFTFLGGSQGGHAALWVDRLAPYYTRELALLGGVATVPPADLTGQVDRALKSLVDATSNSIGFYGASADWYGFEKDLSEVFIAPFDTTVPDTLATSCSVGSLEPQNSLDELFTPEILAAAQTSIAAYGTAGCMAVENSLTTTSVARIPSELPSYGVLNIFGELDPLVNTPIEQAAYTTQCEAGAPFNYLECAGAGHTQSTLWAFGEIFTFIEARLAKEPFTSSCTVTAPAICLGTPE